MVGDQQYPLKNCALRRRKGLKWCSHVSLDFWFLVVVISMSPVGYVAFHVGHFHWATKWQDVLMPGWDKVCNLLKISHMYHQRENNGLRVSLRFVKQYCVAGVCIYSSFSEVVDGASCCSSSLSDWAEARASSTTGEGERAYTFCERASATWFNSPSMQQMSLVNSERNAKCQACQGECHSELFFKVKVWHL